MLLRQIMKQKGFTVERLATEMGIGRVTLQQNLARDSMSTKTLHRIADILGCQIGDFFADEMTEAEHSTSCKCPHCGKKIVITLTAE